MESSLALWMFLAIFIFLLSGYPVAFILAGTGLLFAGMGTLLDVFDPAFLQALPNRMYGIMSNTTLMAVPLFVFMGVMLERSRIAENLLTSMAELFGSVRGGLGFAVLMVGTLMAASTGIVGATVITMGLLSLPSMVNNRYNPAIACGTICASGTLGQIIPPSIALIILGDVISAAYQEAQLEMGIFSPEPVSVGDLFAGALLPGLFLVVLYALYLGVIALLKPDDMPAIAGNNQITTNERFKKITLEMLPPLLLILAVLGSILKGMATPTEAAAVGATGALLLALGKRQLNWSQLAEVCQETTRMTCMVFMILIGAAVFSLVFRGLGGEELVTDLLTDLPGGTFAALCLVMLIIFVLGFVLDFIEITFVVVPIVAPVLLAMDINPIWLGVMIALNLQTSFLTPPFGFSLFYLRGVAPASITTGQIYRGVMPFILIQLLMLGFLAAYPGLATWLPGIIYGN